MARRYNHEKHCYEYGASTTQKAIDRAVNRLAIPETGKHNDKIGDAQPSGLFTCILIAGIVLALVCRVPIADEDVPLLSPMVELCVMGACL
jgi:hypothetical protein